MTVLDTISTADSHRTQCRERKKMEGLYLLSSIITTTVISITLSILLPLQYLHNLLFIKSSFKIEKEEEEENDEPAGSLYQGLVWHERKRPAHNSFKYNSRYALLDLDLAPKSLPSSFFSNHLTAQEARSITSTCGPVFLLTIPPSVGYEQNPLSVYYCYEVEDSVPCLTKCIAEVTNTPWGERVSFVFNPDSDLVAKPLHVSPFMDMLGDWTIRATAPGNTLFVSISVQHPELGDYFIATLTAKRVSSGATDPALFFWLMPHKVALWIYWQALKLWWKNVHFVPHPRYQNPAYREEALTRDRKLQGCPIFVQEDDNSCSNSAAENKNQNRWCVWREAQWPWA